MPSSNTPFSFQFRSTQAFRWLVLSTLWLCFSSCEPEYYGQVLGVNGIINSERSGDWLTHEHILVDFIGAENTGKQRWNRSEVKDKMLPYLLKTESLNIQTFVDATPNFLGRDVELLQELSTASRMNIITNTGLYAAKDYKYLPEYAFEETAQQLADRWIAELVNGIDETGIRPGFIKISINANQPLKPLDRKIVIAAGLTHMETGLTIASHTGPAHAAFEQLSILDSMDVSPQAFIWVHAQQEQNLEHYKKAAGLGCWISLDGWGSEQEDHYRKLLYARRNDLLDNLLISHDAGWYDPENPKAKVTPYHYIPKQLVARMKSDGFDIKDIHKLLHHNPIAAFTILRRLKED